MTITEIGPGQSARITVQAMSGGGATIRVDVDAVDAEPTPEPRGPFYIGMDGYAGTEAQQIIAQFSGLQAMRDFGVKRSGESLPSLTAHGTGQLRDMPRTVRPHCSFKQWDEARVKSWLDTMPAVGDPLAFPEYDMTYHHEPHGDYPEPWPSTYRTRGARLAQIIAAHPNGSRIRHNGPVVTRWWLVESNGNPLDWWYPGANAYGLDAYEDKPLDGGRAWTSEELFGPALDKLYGVLTPDVDIWVPEFGRQYAKGQQRADMIAADLEYLRTQHPRVRSACYYNHQAGGVYSFAYDSPEASAYRAALAA